MRNGNHEGILLDIPRGKSGEITVVISEGIPEGSSVRIGYKLEGLPRPIPGDIPRDSREKSTRENP